MRTALVTVLFVLGMGCSSPPPEVAQSVPTPKPEEPAPTLQDQLTWLKSRRAALAQLANDLERDVVQAAEQYRLAVRAHELTTHDNGGDRNDAERRRKQVEESLNQQAALIEKAREDVRHLREHRLGKYDRLIIEGEERLAAGRSDLLVYPDAIEADYRAAIAQRRSDLRAQLLKGAGATTPTPSKAP